MAATNIAGGSRLSSPVQPKTPAAAAAARLQLNHTKQCRIATATAMTQPRRLKLPIPVTIITGALGVGKTTAICTLLQVGQHHLHSSNAASAQLHNKINQNKTPNSMQQHLSCITNSITVQGNLLHPCSCYILDQHDIWNSHNHRAPPAAQNYPAAGLAHRTSQAMRSGAS